MKTGLPVRLTGLAIAVTLLSACAHQSANEGSTLVALVPVAPEKPKTVAAQATPKPAAAATSTATSSDRKAVKPSRTLADLEGRDVVIEEANIPEPTAEEALNNYQTALALFHSPESRLETLRRMAQFSMQNGSATGTEGIEGKAGPNTTPPLDEKTAASNDANLFSSLMHNRSVLPQGEEDFPNDAASSGFAAPKVSYKIAIGVYQKILAESHNPAELADADYQIAKAYDLNGQHRESIDALRDLARRYPQSGFYVEAQFRVAEDEFSTGRFLSAADRYGLVAKLDKSEFHDQAVYKQGWALYKAADYEAALPVFFAVVEQLRERATHKISAARQSNVNKLLDDTFKIISLTFMQLDGYKSVNAYFAKVGPKPYESDAYMGLGKTYLEKRQYRAAAETFDEFVNRHPLDPRSPVFSSATIDAYQEGGFPTEVIPAKEKFVRRYGPGTAFWLAMNDANRESFMPLLRQHILDLAKFDHAEAQKLGTEQQYMKAVGWYREFLVLNPTPADALTINELLAEALFAGKHFDEAIDEFEKTAYGYQNPKAVDAAYLALVSYQEQAKAFKGTPEQEKAWFDRRVASTLKFARLFPADAHTPDILQGLTDDQLTRKDLPGALITAHLLADLKPTPAEKILLATWTVIGDAESDLNHPQAAEAAYKQALSYQSMDEQGRTKYKDRLATVIYKQADAAKEKNDISGAVANYLRIAATGASEKLVSAAQFDAATLLLNNKRYGQAIPILLEFQLKYPKNDLTSTIPDKLAVAYEQTQQFGSAGEQYEIIARNNAKTNPELGRQAEWAAAELYEKAKRPSDMVRVYQAYIAAYPTPIDAADEAQFKLYSFYSGQRNESEAQKWLQALAQTFDNAGAARTDRVAYLGAMAHFKLCQPLYDAFANIKLTQPLKQSLPAKKQAMQQVLEAYKATVAINVAEFVTASNYQIGEAYRKLAADLRASERPQGLNQDELDQYAELLDEQASPFEDKSIDLYAANAQLTKQNIYDDYVRKSLDALATLSPGRYNKHEQPESFVDAIY